MQWLFVVEGDAEDEQILLPRQSRLGTFDDQPHPSKDEWPATFLCLRHAQTFVRYEQDIHLGPPRISAGKLHARHFPATIFDLQKIEEARGALLNGAFIDTKAAVTDFTAPARHHKFAAHEGRKDVLIR